MDQPPRSQLHIDLERRISETFVRWKRDSTALYEMGGLDTRDVVQDIFIILFTDVIEIMRLCDIDLEEVIRALRSHVKRRRETEATKEGEK